MAYTSLNDCIQDLDDHGDLIDTKGYNWKECAFWSICGIIIESLYECIVIHYCSQFSTFAVVGIPESIIHDCYIMSAVGDFRICRCFGCLVFLI